MWRYSEENLRHQGNKDLGCVRGRGRGSVTKAAYRDDCFTVLHPQRYKRDAPPLSQPTVLGSFSVDSKKNIHFDDSMMPVLSSKYLPDGEFMKVDLDLNKGWHRVNHFTGTSADGFRNLLEWILRNKEKVAGKDSSKSFEGTVYLTTEVPEQEKSKTKEEGSLLDIYGHKFEHYMTGGDPDDVLECNCQFRCVLQLQLNEMSLLFAPDTDAVDLSRHKKDFKDMNSFVRLKSRVESTNPNAERNYRRYTLNGWWIENKLAGVPRLLVGTRNSEGVVHTLQMLQTDDFPGMGEGKWKPSVCINVLHLFLDFVKRRVVAEPDVVHRFEKYAPALHNIHHSCDPNLMDILPNWYKQMLFNTQDEESDWSRGSD